MWRIEERRDLVEDVEVLDDALPDVGPLDLDDDLPAVAHRGTMDLPERGRGHGLGVELGERLREAHAELGMTMLSTSAKEKGSTLSCRRASASR